MEKGRVEERGRETQLYLGGWDDSWGGEGNQRRTQAVAAEFGGKVREKAKETERDSREGSAF